ncbi:hypothetical protein [Gilvimarinus xylanilyticus]|uniref:Uncharacterized protein n=1 Tax=Gilvimarinus xylanilyticus TaxID=2944139 RepID=A0A9X2I201_9GAMM|nr:hypothetical protein [Gilvimarinus xylanilyticus]MCP8899273.1 hypothetical protein [Gilvimarinus xylanilyticus]
MELIDMKSTFEKPHEIPGYCREGSTLLWNGSITVNAKALRYLVEDAKVGIRVFELLSIARPGELLNYLLLSFDESNPSLLANIKSSLKQYSSGLYTEVRDQNQNLYLPLTALDKRFGLELSSSSDLHRDWQNSRTLTPFWNDYLTDLFQLIKAEQNSIYKSPDPLIRAEISLIEAIAHPQQFVRALDRQPILRTNQPYIRMPESLVERLIELVDQYSIQSVSAEEGGYVFWHELLKRQISLGTENLELRCGCDHPKPPFIASHVGGAIDNGVEAELMVRPSWKAVTAEQCEKKQQLPYPAKVLVTEQDWPGMTFVDHERIEGWNIYIDRAWRIKKENKDLVSETNH